jgi:hypothetical protein
MDAVLPREEGCKTAHVRFEKNIRNIEEVLTWVNTQVLPVVCVGGKVQNFF